VSYNVPAATASAAVNAVTALINAGSTNPTGALQMRNASTLIANLNFNNPAFATTSTGTATMNNSPAVSGTVTPAGQSTIDRFRMVDRNSGTIIDGLAGSVAISGADIQISSVTVNQNDVIEITGLNMSVPLTGP
jgi:hypothetical protein